MIPMFVAIIIPRLFHQTDKFSLTCFLFLSFIILLYFSLYPFRLHPARNGCIAKLNESVFWDELLISSFYLWHCDMLLPCLNADGITRTDNNWARCFIVQSGVIGELGRFVAVKCRAVAPFFLMLHRQRRRVEYFGRRGWFKSEQIFACFALEWITRRIDEDGLLVRVVLLKDLVIWRRWHHHGFVILSLFRRRATLSFFRLWREDCVRLHCSRFELCMTCRITLACHWRQLIWFGQIWLADVV